MSLTAQPELTTDRLLLRPFALADAPDVQRLAGAREVAANTLHIPHPYEDGMAEAWIGTHPEQWARGGGVVFAIMLRGIPTLVGAIGLILDSENARAELGYWIGTPFWGRGYASEAARALLDFGFGTLGLNRIHAHHFARNPASGAVMRKAGMRREGALRQHVRKWGKFEDLEAYGLLRAEWEAARVPAHR